MSGSRSRLIASVLSVVVAGGCALTPADVPNLKAQARDAAQEGRHTDALRALRRAGALAPDDAEVFFLQGAVALRAGRPGEAEAALARAVELEPHDPRPLSAHGLALRALRRYPEAESALLRSLMLRPADPPTLAALGELYRLWGHPEKCVARYEQYLWKQEQEADLASDSARESALALARLRLEECQEILVKQRPRFR